MYLTTALLIYRRCSVLGRFLGYVHEGGEQKFEILRWVGSGALSANWVLRIDTLTAVMLVVVTTVSALVHVYSIGYMGHDPHQPRFFSYLSLFTFAMLMLVTSDNLLQLFFGWEGVGLASYLLIGFWYKRPSANAAAIKAFIVNRVGDFGFALGIFAVFKIFGTIEFDTLFSAAPRRDPRTAGRCGGKQAAGGDRRATARLAGAAGAHDAQSAVAAHNRLGAGQSAFFEGHRLTGASRRRWPFAGFAG